ncbi:MAG: Hint domain-containing protein [Boseongicola sp.]|nr:Hint domain-containing protein [Boseongicola sp.]
MSKSVIQPDVQDTINRVMERFKTARDEFQDTASDSAQDAANCNAQSAQDEAEDVPFETSEVWPLPGLAPMTRVRTSFGDVHAVALRKGDLVRTRSGEFKEIVWLNRVMLDEAFLAQKPDSNPVRIGAGAVGPSTPSADIMVSPRQVLCPSANSQVREAREAADLESRPGVTRRRETGLSYTMFHVGGPAEVLCEGVYMLFEPPKG